MTNSIDDRRQRQVSAGFRGEIVLRTPWWVPIFSFVFGALAVAVGVGGIILFPHSDALGAAMVSLMFGYMALGLAAARRHNAISLSATSVTITYFHTFRVRSASVRAGDGTELIVKRDLRPGRSFVELLKPMHDNVRIALSLVRRKDQRLLLDHLTRLTCAEATTEDTTASGLAADAAAVAIRSVLP